MKDTDLAWAAGIIDGEGCIYIKKTPSTQCRKTKNDTYTLGLRVVMGHEAAIRRLHELFQVGNCYKLQQRGYNDAWSFMCSARKAEVVLELVRPYLFVKSEEADVAFEFLRLPLWRPGGNGGCFAPTPPELITKKEQLYERMRDLKPSSRFRRRKEVK